MVLAIYLVSFFGFRGWRALERSRADYQQLLLRVEREQLDVQRYENDLLLFEKLSEAFRFDPRKLSKETLVAEASAAIQDTARLGGFQLGPVRETPGRATSQELSTIQFDGMGPLPAALALVHKLQTLGYPLVIDSLQFSQDPRKPGMLNMSVTVVILNFERWQKGTPPNA
jgi:hypothetical protein